MAYSQQGARYDIDRRADTKARPSIVGAGRQARGQRRRVLAACQTGIAKRRQNLAVARARQSLGGGRRAAANTDTWRPDRHVSPVALTPSLNRSQPSARPAGLAA